MHCYEKFGMKSQKRNYEIDARQNIAKQNLNDGPAWSWN
jgi:hypothetical protein